MTVKHVLVSFLALVLLTSTGFAAEEKFEDPTLKTVFSHLPEINSHRTKEMVAEYTDLAKQFWLNKECDYLAGNAKKEFIDNLATITGIVRKEFMVEFSMNAQEAQKEAEKPQMWALNEMSAKKFYGCDKAKSNDLVFAIVNSRGFIKKYK